MRPGDAVRIRDDQSVGIVVEIRGEKWATIYTALPGSLDGIIRRRVRQSDLDVILSRDEEEHDEHNDEGRDSDRWGTSIAGDRFSSRLRHRRVGQRVQSKVIELIVLSAVVAACLILLVAAVCER